MYLSRGGWIKSEYICRSESKENNKKYHRRMAELSPVDSNIGGK